ncbi:MAG TPA: DUF2795 domain-containing protein [Ktedonobacteraceae bacterium]
MQLDWNQLNQSGHLDMVLSILSFPVDKNAIIAHVQETGADSQIIIAMKNALPDQKFHSPEEIKQCIPHEGQQQYH